MKLHVFVDAYQIEDRGILTTGDELLVDLRGSPIGDLVFHSPSRTKALRRTGIFEYLFAGEVKEVRSETPRDRPEPVWQHILLDCGLPVTVIHIGWQPLRLLGSLSGSPHVTSSSINAHIAGAIFLKADISFFSPLALAAPVEARVHAIETVMLGQESVIKLEQVGSIDARSADGKTALGAILEIGVENT